MAIFIGLDIGGARTGVAESDPSGSMAFPMVTVATDQLLDHLRQTYGDQEIAGVVVGEPKRLSGEATQGSAIVEAQVAKIREAHPEWTFHMVDERFTSKIAAHAAAVSGAGKAVKKNKGLLDASAAAIILDSYLQQL